MQTAPHPPLQSLKFPKSRGTYQNFTKTKQIPGPAMQHGKGIPPEINLAE